MHWGDLPKACHCLKQAIQPIRRHVLAQSMDYEIKSHYILPWQSDCRDAKNTSQCYGHWKLTPLLHLHSQGQICSHPPTNSTNKACLPTQQLMGKQMCQQSCATISLKPVLSWQFCHLFFNIGTSLLRAHFITS